MGHFKTFRKAIGSELGLQNSFAELINSELAELRTRRTQNSFTERWRKTAFFSFFTIKAAELKCQNLIVCSVSCRIGEGHGAGSVRRAFFARNPVFRALRAAPSYVLRALFYA